jgi:hypothetical protein
MKRSFAFAVRAVMFGSLSATAQQSATPVDWSAWDFLIGDWTPIGGGGQPGQAIGGGFSFGFDLQKRILVRKSYAEYPATKDALAFRHDDLMIVYEDETGKGTRAVYFDNEGHVIHYTVAFSDGGGAVTFVSDANARGPRFRLIYRKQGDGAVAFEFDIAPPGKPDAFAKYVEGAARRKSFGSGSGEPGLRKPR